MKCGAKRGQGHMPKVGTNKKQRTGRHRSGHVEAYRMQLRDWYRSCPRMAMLVCGCVLLAASILVRTLCGSPWESVAALALRDRLPSFWGMTLIWSAWYFVLGALFGAIMFSGEPAGVICVRTVEKYRGGMYFITMILLGFLWYPLFFVTARLALAALLSLAVTVLALLCALSYWRISRVAGAIMLAHALYLFVFSFWGISLLFAL